MAFLRDRSVFCIPTSILTFNEGYIIGGICIVTSSVGFLGAALQIKSLRGYRGRQRRRPSPNPSIIFYLALSDLVACIGVFALAIALMVLDKPQKITKGYRPSHNDVYAPLGTSIEVVTLFAYLASYIWTLSYALDMCFQMYRVECSMIVYHILAWMIPLQLVTIIEAVNFGQYPSVCERYYGRLSRLILSYFPVMTVMFANPVIFLVTYKKVKQQLRSSGRYTVVDRDALNLCKRKFFWMIVAFTICWLPNIFSVSYDLVTFNHSYRMSKLDKLWFVEAFFNPLQGIFNYFLYRHSFQVTATDTRPAQDSLPRVARRRMPSLPKNYTEDGSTSTLSTNQTVQRITDSSTNCNEETPLVNSMEPRDEHAPPYVYISKLLGE